ncbi:MAG: AEC family transporter [Verrucomicrobia bacterium]|nr:AEC family transporter [Verrucomicrobiota bacterium]
MDTQSSQLMTLVVLFRDVCLPIVVLFGTGWALDRKFKFDLQTLVRLNIYLFVPAFIFVKVTEAQLDGRTGLKIILFTLTSIACMGFISSMTARWFRDDIPTRKSLQLSTMFYNCGNYGIPLMTLAFPTVGPLVQVFVLMTMNVSTFTLGLFIAHSSIAEGAGHWRQSLGPVFRQPAIYAITLAWIFKGLDIPVQQVVFLWRPLEYLAEGLVGFALITLGVQLSKTKVKGLRGPLTQSLIIRLIGGPCIGILLTWLFGFEGKTAAILILGTASPAAVNTALLAYEFKANSQFAAATVFYSTLLSILVVTLLLSIITFGWIPWAVW